MRKLSEYQDEEALELLADLMEPVMELVGDKDFLAAMREGKRTKAIKIAIKGHKPQIMEILAGIERVPVEEYHCNVLTLPLRLLEVMRDSDLLTVFTSQVQEMMQSTSSGPVTENTEDGEQ